MTDVSQETRKISISYERKQDLGDYSNETARAWVETSIPPDANEAQVATELGKLFTAAKAAVYDELGIEYTVDPETGLVTETPQVKAVVTNITRAFPNTTVGGEIRVMNKAEADENGNGDLPEWLVAECNKLGVTAVWDRRHSAKGNQPQFQEAVGHGKTGHGKDGSGKGFWPPK